MQTIRLHYSGHGKGEKAIIFFHGFGQNLSAFDGYKKELQDHFRLFFVDLPSHGESTFLKNPMNRQQWANAFKDFLKAENIDQFAIVAFSLGGRFALATLPYFETCLEGIYLLAPDGIYQSPWYSFATSFPGNLLFRVVMKNEKLFNTFLLLTEKTGLASNASIRFARKQLPTQKDKERLYSTWTYMKPLAFRKKALLNQLKSTKTVIHIFLGNQDLLISKEKVRSKLNSVKHINWHIISARHNQMIDMCLLPVSRLLKGDRS